MVKRNASERLIDRGHPSMIRNSVIASPDCRRIAYAVLSISKSGTAIISPGPPRLGPDPKWDRRNALKVICRLVFEAAHQAH